MLSRSSTVIGVALVAALAAPGFSGCVEREISVVDPSTQSGVLEKIRQTGTTKVDILFVIDSSGSMHQEQEVLAEQVVDMARELLEPSPVEGRQPRAVEDLHIGIVSTDMGTGGYSVQTCANPNNGDNGVLQNTGRLPGCLDVYRAADCVGGECRYLSHSEEHPDDGRTPGDAPIWEDFGCIATLGTAGCGFEQPLEASLAALTRQAEAGRPNEGFLREDSLLAVIYVTDEDDCSTPNAEMFNRQRDDYGPINTRCALNPNELYPVQRYIDGLRGLRPGREDMVVVAAIVGVPVDGRWNPGDPVERLRELQRPRPDDPTELEPSCDTDMGVAFPPVRFAELVYGFGNDGILESICRNDWSAALQAVTRRIQLKLEGTCVQRELASSGAEACTVVETLVGDAPCPHPADDREDCRTSGWHVDRGLDADGNRQCEILPADYDGDGWPDEHNCRGEQLAAPLDGWYYVADHPVCEHGQVRFTHDDVTSDLSSVRFECRTALCPQRRQCLPAAADAPSCDPAAPSSCGIGATCVQHISGDLCGWTTVTTESGEEVLRPQTCGRCSPTLGATCSAFAGWPLELTERPLLDTGACCAEGFHCEDGACRPDRTTECDASTQGPTGG